MRNLLFGAVTLSFVAANASPQTPITVEDSKVRAIQRDSRTLITIPVKSTLDRTTAAHLALLWVDPKGTVMAKDERDLSIAPGTQAIEAPFPLPDNRDPIWLRLNYRLSPALSDVRTFVPLSGTFALSEIASYSFELKTASVGTARPGHPLTVRARATHPQTGKPVSGVRFEAALELGDREISPRSSTNDSLGFVSFTFDVPQSMPAGTDLEVDVDATLGDYSQSESADVRIEERTSATLQTDKPIYQPGQMLHIRGVVLGPSGRAAAGEEVELTIDDPESNTAHHATLTSTRLGVVHDDWKLPAGAALGTWNLKLGDVAVHSIRVSRYELPSFTVAVTPDRESYLPGQSARIAVQGSYLFGKPIPKGKVRIVRPDSNEEEAAGEADASGKFVASINLDADHDELKTQAWNRFNDLKFTACFTDPSTGRTERRRFDVRLTRAPLHVYVTVPSRGSESLPTPVYVAAYYASGKPAVADVEIRNGNQAVRVRTNRFGVARALCKLSGEEIVAHVTDDAGLTGEWRETNWNLSKDGFRVETDKSIYRNGDPVRVRVLSTHERDVMVDATVDGALIASRSVHIGGGAGEVEFPFNAAFRRQVVFVAWTDREMEGFWGYKAVVFPAATDLRLGVAPDKTEYRPGDHAGVRMTLASADGHPVTGVFGAAVVDQAVMERARTDNEFGKRPWFSCMFCGSPNETLVGGVSLNDIYNLDLAKPLPEGLDLVAEILLANESLELQIDCAQPYYSSLRSTFGDATKSQFELVRQALERHYNSTLAYPRNEAELFLAAPAFGQLKDPWGTPYRAQFSIEGANDVLRFLSAGPDKKFGTEDDFVVWKTQWLWFRLQEKLIGDTLGNQDFPATVEEFGELLGRNGIRIDTFGDRWGHPLRVKISTWGRMRTAEFQSAGPDGKFDTPDDVEVCRFHGVYFQRESAAIDEALRLAYKPPASEEQVRGIVSRAGIDLSKTLDPWGRPYSIKLRTSSRYTDRSQLTTVKVYQGAEETKRDITPVTQKLLTIALRSAGPDGVEGTNDDFDVADFVTVVGEETAVSAAQSSGPRVPGTGVIAGIVTDASGAVIPNVTVKLLEPASGETKTNESGAYAFIGLPPGEYSLRFEAPGFQRGEMVRIPVASGHTTSVNFVLQVGSVNETVEVNASALPLNASTAAFQLESVAATATPRVRDYFPETLLWTPEIETDQFGRAHLHFNLADNITTWKVAVFASTEDGRSAETEADLLAFQPFFIDHNPPPVLTTGDEIHLPVTIRNYLDREQKVSVEMQPNAWSELHGPAKQQVNVLPNGSSNVIYSLRARAPESVARQRIIAAGAKVSDAIEKTLLVHPDGREVTQTIGDVAVGPTSLRVTIPAAAIPGATRGELRLYPGLLSTLIEGLDGIIQRPYGCAEQTTSAGFANLIALRFARSVGYHNAKLESRALPYIGEARDSLLRLAAPGGGITYWGRGDPDIAVTAYALTFLIAASQFVEVDRDDLQTQINWLAKQPRAKSLLTTALIARALAAARKEKFKVSPAALAEAYHEMATLTDSLDEPYMLATFTLAAIDSGDSDLARPAVGRLEKIAQHERDGLFWDLKANTPFYGWGAAGRMETSGLAVSALAAWRQGHPEDVRLDAVIRGGLLFLLRHRDRYGVWYSTQATMRAMKAIADASPVLPGFGVQDGSVEVRVNGRPARTVQLPLGGDPVLLDVSSLLATGDTEIELSPSNAGATIARLVTTHWIPWTQPSTPANAELRLKVDFSQTEAVVGSVLQCTVDAERVGFHGYGMMIAEVGLPPGAEVDRESLDGVIGNRSLGVDQYDVLPDKLVFYLWPKAGSAKFSFKFVPRFAMTAKSGPAALFDYYNPEVGSQLPPQLFRIRSH
jgi:hypothetical protein